MEVTAGGSGAGGAAQGNDAPDHPAQEQPAAAHQAGAEAPHGDLDPTRCVPTAMARVRAPARACWPVGGPRHTRRHQQPHDRALRELSNALTSVPEAPHAGGPRPATRALPHRTPAHRFARLTALTHTHARMLSQGPRRQAAPAGRHPAPAAAPRAAAAHAPPTGPHHQPRRRQPPSTAAARRLQWQRGPALPAAAAGPLQLWRRRRRRGRGQPRLHASAAWRRAPQGQLPRDAAAARLPGRRPRGGRAREPRLGLGVWHERRGRGWRGGGPAGGGWGWGGGGAGAGGHARHVGGADGDAELGRGGRGGGRGGGGGAAGRDVWRRRRRGGGRRRACA